MIKNIYVPKNKSSRSIIFSATRVNTEFALRMDFTPNGKVAYKSFSDGYSTQKKLSETFDLIDHGSLISREDPFMDYMDIFHMVYDYVPDELIDGQAICIFNRIMHMINNPKICIEIDPVFKLGVLMKVRDDDDGWGKINAYVFNCGHQYHLCQIRGSIDVWPSGPGYRWPTLNGGCNYKKVPKRNPIYKSLKSLTKMILQSQSCRTEIMGTPLSRNVVEYFGSLNYSGNDSKVAISPLREVDDHG